MAKLQAYQLQDAGIDTIEANHALGFKADLRDFSLAAEILRDLRIPRVRLLTNNPRKVRALSDKGIEVVERIRAVRSGRRCIRSAYLQTKKQKMGHALCAACGVSGMMYTHSLGRAARYYPERAAIGSGERRSTFRQLHDRVAGIVAALSGHGFERGDRLALLLPNEPEYLELIYACSWLGVIAVPVNARLSVAEIDRILADASPRGIVRHSSLPAPTVQLPWQRVLDKEPLDAAGASCPDPIYDPDAILALIYTSGTTGRPKGVVVTHANILADIDHLNYWLPHREGGVHLHAAPIFHILDFPFIFAAPAFGTCQITIPKFSPANFCETVSRERVSRTVLVPTMINLLTQFPELNQFDLTSLESIAYGGSPMAPELVRRTREVLPHVKLVQGYGLTETGLSYRPARP